MFGASLRSLPNSGTVARLLRCAASPPGGWTGEPWHREFIKVPRLLENATLPELSGAGEYALSIGTNSADAVKLILEARQCGGKAAISGELKSE
jgi:hypothetical protein